MTAGPVPAPDADPLAAALDYARRGLRVLPILPGAKRPPMAAWQDAATTDPDTITSWFTGPYRGHGVGIATGPASGIWALDVDDYAAYRALEAANTPLPDTLTNLTGSGGMHFLFRYPTDGRTIRNSASTRLGPGLDVRGDGGQIVAPPTVHPNGKRYEWDAGQGETIIDAPDWLLELVCDPPPAPARISLPDHRLDDHVRPGDALDQVDWADLLEADGWQLSHTDQRTGERHWTRPGKTTRDGTSATTGYTPNDNLKVFTSSMQHAGLQPEETYTKLGYWAATRHHGDHQAAAADLRARGYGTPTTTSAPTQAGQHDAPDALSAEPDTATTWELVDLDSILDGTYEPPTPTIAKISATKALIYPGRVHSIAGEPGGGKTWLALHIIAEQINDGGSGALIDYEDTASAAVHRLRLLGLSDEQIRSQFRYLRPDGPLVAKSGRINVAALDVLEQLDVDVVVIDSVGESLAVEGLPPNDDDAVTQWFRRLPRMLARRGAAVIGLDHVTKSKDDRGLWAIGSQRKLAAIDGAAYGVDVRTAPTKDKDGELKITCAKDRHGTYQRGHMVAKVHIRNVDNGVSVDLQAPDDRFRPTVYMERISRFLEEIPSASQRGILQGVNGKDPTLKVALECLVDEGFVNLEVTGRGNQYSLTTTYRDDETTEQPVDNPETGDRVPPRPHRVPPVGDAVQEGPQNDRVPRGPNPLRSRGSAGTRSEAPGEHEPHPKQRVRVPPTNPTLDLSEF
jgi:hypothetical protein